MSFSITFEKDAVCPWSGARAARLATPHGTISTPAFMPVATNASLRSMNFTDVVECGAEIILSNAYHLYLRPGHELIASAGGLHKFMAWKLPILTDSGGFQVFSLDQYRRIADDGVHFRDHRSGRAHFISPAISMEIQNAIGADIIMAFDECVKNPATHNEAEVAMNRTHQWLEICEATHSRKNEQALFGIIQGSMFEDLRRKSAEVVTSFDLPGYAIGGVAVGEARGEIERIVKLTTPLMPENKPRYLMGIGTPWDILYAIRCGIDMFDCVAPTMIARHGSVFTSKGRISLNKAACRTDFGPIDELCDCYTCKFHSRAYLHHLIRAQEYAGATLAAIHNVRYLIKETTNARQAILDGNFREYFEKLAPILIQQNEDRALLQH
ncbi:MAG: tRNA guanosine(34) transglycosylase Tgt [Candidatus Melainabacteria bacterium]|nr:tRNA guanosine(34) transglycosylase Tgt [Candidatus Melainabacteria bacterium]